MLLFLGSSTLLCPPRKLAVYPKGHNTTTHMSVFLHWNDAATTPPELNPTISYTVTLVNQQDRSKDIKRAVIC